MANEYISKDDWSMLCKALIILKCSIHINIYKYKNPEPRSIKDGDNHCAFSYVLMFHIYY